MALNGAEVPYAEMARALATPNPDQRQFTLQVCVGVWVWVLGEGCCREPPPSSFRYASIEGHFFLHHFPPKPKSIPQPTNTKHPRTIFNY